jgi:hypothetical protein
VQENRRKTYIGVDFGNLTTKLTIRSGHSGKDLVPVVIPGLSRKVSMGGDNSTSIIPSLIHYTRDDKVLIGMEVINEGLLGDEGTVRWNHIPASTALFIQTGRVLFLPGCLPISTGIICKQARSPGNGRGTDRRVLTGSASTIQPGCKN